MVLSDSLVCRSFSLAAKHIAYNGANQIVKEGVKESLTDVAEKGAQNGAEQVAKEGAKGIRKRLFKGVYIR